MSMPTLSARFVRQPQKRYVCDWCERPICASYEAAITATEALGKEGE